MNEAVDLITMACLQLDELLHKKRQDYGPNNIKRFGLKGIVVRLADKVERLVHLTWERQGQPNYETLADTLVDIAGYAVLGLEQVGLPGGRNQVEERVRADGRESEFRGARPAGTCGEDDAAGKMG